MCRHLDCFVFFETDKAQRGVGILDDNIIEKSFQLEFKFRFAGCIAELGYTHIRLDAVGGIDRRVLPQGDGSALYGNGAG